MMKRISKIALALPGPGPLLAGCAKSPFASDGSSAPERVDEARLRGRSPVYRRRHTARLARTDRATPPDLIPREFARRRSSRTSADFDRYDIRGGRRRSPRRERGVDEG